MSWPQCGGRVRYHLGVGGKNGSWKDHHPGAPEPRVEPGARGEYARALNHCRPCSFLTCRFHILTDVTDKGSLRISDRTALESDDALASVLASMEYTCALDVADVGGFTLQAGGDVAGTTRERNRQLIETSLQYVRDTVTKRFHLRVLDTLDAIEDFDPDRATVEAPTSTALDTLPRVVRVLPSPPPVQPRPTLDAEGRAIAALGMLATNPRRIVARGQR